MACDEAMKLGLATIGLLGGVVSLSRTSRIDGPLSPQASVAKSEYS